MMTHAHEKSETGKDKRVALAESGSGPMFEIVIQDNGIDFNENFSE